MLTIRLVVKDQKGVILRVREINRYRPCGGFREDLWRNLKGMDKLLDEVHEAIKQGDHPTFEFLDYDLQKEKEEKR